MEPAVGVEDGEAVVERLERIGEQLMLLARRQRTRAGRGTSAPAVRGAWACGAGARGASSGQRIASPPHTVPSPSVNGCQRTSTMPRATPSARSSRMRELWGMPRSVAASGLPPPALASHGTLRARVRPTRSFAASPVMAAAAGLQTVILPVRSNATTPSRLTSISAAAISLAAGPAFCACTVVRCPFVAIGAECRGGNLKISLTGTLDTSPRQKLD